MRRLLRLLHVGFAVIAGVALVVMLLVTVVDIVLRVFGAPLPGAYEIIGWLAAVAMASALAYTQAHKGHVAIDLLIARFPPRVRLLTEAFTSLVAALLLGVATWQLLLYAYDLQLTGSLSQTLRTPVYPWVYAVGGGVGMLALVLAHDAIGAIAGLKQGRRRGALVPGAAEP